MSLPYIGEQLTIYIGSFPVITGVIGNGINIWIFSSVRSYRQTPCTFYFLIGSIFNILYLLILLISRIVMSGTTVDLTRTSVGWCKMRNFFLPTLCLVSLLCSCLAAIDQFFATSKNPSIRRLSNLKWSYRIIVVSIVLCCLHGIPNILYFNISPTTNTCVSTSKAFAIYFPSIYILTLNCAIPVAVMMIFGYLAYRNINLTIVLAQQRAERQLMRMIMIDVLLAMISFIPYGINGAYTLITARIVKDPYRIQIENFAYTIASVICYFYYSVC